MHSRCLVWPGGYWAFVRSAARGLVNVPEVLKDGKINKKKACREKKKQTTERAFFSRTINTIGNGISIYVMLSYLDYFYNCLIIQCIYTDSILKQMTSSLETPALCSALWWSTEYFLSPLGAEWCVLRLASVKHAWARAPWAARMCRGTDIFVFTTALVANGTHLYADPHELRCLLLVLLFCRHSCVSRLWCEAWSVSFNNR